jgi:hypothetical protein
MSEKPRPFSIVRRGLDSLERVTNAATGGTFRALHRGLDRLEQQSRRPPDPALGTQAVAEQPATDSTAPPEGSNPSPH